MKMRYLLLFFMFIALSGCTHFYSYGQKDITDSDKIKTGVSTKEDVLELFGKPQDVLHIDDGTQIFMYEYVNNTFKDATFISQATKRLIIKFDEKAVIKDKKFDEMYTEIPMDYRSGPYYMITTEGISEEKKEAAEKIEKEKPDIVGKK